MLNHSLLVTVFVVALLPALGLVFIPLFPTFWYLMGVTLLFAFVDGFIHLTSAHLVILGGIFAASLAVDWSAGFLGARFGGAAWKSLLYGAIGGGIGFLLMPPLGAFLGLFLGVLVGELQRMRSTREALKAASGAFLGTIAGIALNAVLVLAFILCFIAFAL